MKGDPQSRGLVEIPLNERFLDFFKYLRAQVGHDREDRAAWIDKNKKFHLRRYGMDKRRTNFPFPGAADIWPPLSDMVVEQMKSLYLNLLLLSSPPVTAVAMGEELEDRTQDVETFFEYLINYKSPHFMQEQHYYIDDILSCGMGFLKTFWQYETRTAPEILKSHWLPDEIAARIVRPDLRGGAESLYFNEKDFDKIAWEPMPIGGELHPSTVTLLESKYDLDREDKRDRQALGQILEWLKTGAKDDLTIKKRDTVIDAPATVSIMPENIIMPSSATDVEDSFHISHEMWMNGFQVRQRARDARWRPEAADEMLDSGKGHEDPRMRSGVAQLEAQRQKINWSGGDKYHVIESCTWFDHDNDGIDEKIVVLWSPSAEKPLRAYAYDRPSGLWPYHLSEFERNKRGVWSSRGIPERLQDIERELVVQKRAELNRLMISSSLSLLVRSGSPVANQSIRWVPGEKLICADINNDVKPLVIPDLSVVFQQQERLWKVWAESYIGTPNYAIADPLSNLNEPRTAREITAIQTQGRSIGHTRTSIYREQMSRVFHEMFDLWTVFGDPEVWVNAVGSEPIKLTKENLQGAYSFVLGPLVGMDDPVLEAQKALARVQILSQIAGSGLMPPDVRIDMAAAVKEWLRKDDPRSVSKILKPVSPEEQEQMQRDQQMRDQMQGVMLGTQAAGGNGAQRGGKPMGMAG